MLNAERFAYARTNNATGEIGLVPQLPITLAYASTVRNKLSIYIPKLI